ncbi:MAG: EAL domain-containing protein [Thermoanaerobaculia bacterium]|nr:EAL domain-containing protein [Thermoanaerobaculia bacterium]
MLEATHVTLTAGAVGAVLTALSFLFRTDRTVDSARRWALCWVLLSASSFAALLAIWGSMAIMGTPLVLALFAAHLALLALGYWETAGGNVAPRGGEVALVLGFVLGGAAGIAGIDDPLRLGGAVAAVSGALVFAGALLVAWRSRESLSQGMITFSVLSAISALPPFAVGLALFGGAPSLTALQFLALLVSLPTFGCAFVVLLMEDSRLAAASTAAEHERLAYHDPLTGLPNRMLLEDRLRQVLAVRDREGSSCALLFVDLDHFKEINDSLGHAAGDELLREVAARINSVLRLSDTLARFGGDEFVVLVPRVTSAEDAMTVASKLIEAVRRPLRLAGSDLLVTASVGIAISPEHGADGETLVRSADAAMYRAKRQGRNDFQVFTPAMSAPAKARPDLEARLLHGIENGELVLHYQPVVGLRSMRLVAIEALVRWNHPQMGMLLPANFVGVAERCGLIEPMGRWVIDRALSDIGRLQAAFGDELVMSINVSIGQVTSAGFPDEIEGALARAGVPASRLALELGEADAARELDAVGDALARLRELGVSLVVDDFGSGLSSVTRLARMPFEIVKLDRSLVAGISARGGEDLARAVIELAHALGKSVTAQGVETESQLTWLAALGCDRLQGHLIGHALPVGELIRERSEAYATGRIRRELTRKAGYVDLGQALTVRKIVASTDGSAN